MYSRNYGCRIDDQIVIHGNRALVMENQIIRVTYLIEQGMDCVELLYKPSDIDLMWRSPVDLHRRSDYHSTTGDSLGNYLDHNSGGWQEILPNGGGPCSYKGAALGMHGEISCVPWDVKILKDTEQEVSFTARIKTLRSPFCLEKTVVLRENEGVLRIHEKLVNLAEEPMDLMWGNHPTVGKPFLDDSCRIETNGRRVMAMEQPDFETQRVKPGAGFGWPLTPEGIDLSKIPAEGAGTADMLYITDFPEKANYRVYSGSKDLAYGMCWDGRRFPYMWMWLVCNGSYGYPWYGRTYNLALEPWSSYPSGGLNTAIENGSAMHMEPHEICETDLLFWVGKGKEEYDFK